MRNSLSGRKWKHFHWTVAVCWLFLAIPTLIWWSESILWVAFMSLYANVASHWSAAQAAEAEERAGPPSPVGTADPLPPR